MPSKHLGSSVCIQSDRLKFEDNWHIFIYIQRYCMFCGPTLYKYPVVSQSEGFRIFSSELFSKFQCRPAVAGVANEPNVCYPKNKAIPACAGI